MSIYPWIEKIDFQKFAMPLVVKIDNEYYPGIVEKLADLVFELERCGASDKIVLAVKEYRKKIISSIILYYQGDLVDAQLIVNEMLDEFNDAAPAITDINSSIAFPGGGPDYSEVQFFRARLSENVVEFSSEDMLHIPFNKRHIVKSERFSIPGLPCLYLGNSSYACWVEMGCPADHRFNVAPILLDNTQKVLNLTVSISALYAFNESENTLSESENENYVISLLKLFVLTLCTSYKVEETNRNFKSEYILPQMLMRVVAETAENTVKPRRIDFCSAGPVHRCIHTVSHVVEDHADKIGVPSRFAATRVIEEDAEIISALKLSDNELELIGHAVLEMENEGGLDRNAALAEMRYRFIEAVCSECVIKAQESKEMLRSVKIDKVLTNKYLAIPMFIAIMGFIFWMTFSVLGKWLSDLLALGIDEVTALVDNALTAYGLNPVVHSLVIDGVFAGVGSMLSFLPIIVVLFFFLAILEDTGYMSRVAFVMDKLLRRIGLSGRSFVPMLIGFGCSVPAIMATRTLSSERDRKMTMLLIPFMSCSAKIPIYAVFTAAFFPDHGGLVMTCLYVFGMLVGIIAAKVLSKTAFTGKPVPFVMELPNYRMPSLKSVLLLMWEKAWDFIRRAFTVIFAATIVIWFLQHFDVRLNVVGEGSTDSLLAIIGTWIAPVFAPLGFGDWRVATALLTGLMAKEAVISTLGVLMNVGANLGSAALGGLFTLPSAVSFLVFCLLYTPCVAALAALRRELGSGVKTVLVMISQCCVAWLAAFCVYALIGVIF